MSFELSAEERDVVLDTLRFEIRHQERNRRQLVRKYGARARTSMAVSRVRLLTSAFVKLGGKADHLTINRSEP